ncbi:MAG: DUF2156 domain-containing protein [Lentisphaeria bacterium]|nr:DUF2156 domain-containing protein [Lentisphaeria bacterium]
MIFDQFKSLEAENYELFRRFSCFAGESCERSWANLLLYKDTYNWRYKVIENRLWIASFEKAYLFFPLGCHIGVELLAGYFQEFAARFGCDAVLGDVPEDYFRQFPDAGKYLEFEFDPDEADYIYDLEHLQAMSGSKLRKRRNQVRQFDREYGNCYSVKIITFEMLDEIIAFAEKQSSLYWSEASGLEEKLSFDRLKSVWQYPEVGLSGIALYVKESLAGFSIYSPLQENLADIHFEKADHAFTGCGAKLTALLTEHLLAGKYRFMNREQDLGDVGLRQAKRALDPDHLYCRASVTALK